ncbi:TetR family transcriptional regulator [Saccharopolyspora erythraea NRRL 2338]|uniref:Transcriptional regulator, TetR family n=2 Tax=Saccharopolyspora erythraea TaxID=1836 RepID=A4F6Q8_SACEN|nr:TetR/AcrR family transcriptional regulator [Saccharopolyspora erythraea]EQD87308.1 TetR family transcriptional regulator [Saccharopolyspora erythraea D]PFG93535.1 TetR family transcriptional regulator [Saccharopolyspora erythraea NRRL 2338]QRK90389.1 TetR/AcrR family transcriptional regulator [Saccharopolyspora erythraea]CAL99732.1 transcriptional regulator, TetR family [Saccharopolyspora erythraea NRRL 2338]
MPADLPGIVRLRDRREALTLRTILTAARGLFAERGYARTPIRLIAKEAGVAPQTIYAHYGSKAGVLTGLVDLLDDEAGIPDLMAEADAMADPEALIGLLARVSRQVRERCGDIVAIMGSGAAVDADIAATQAEAQRRNRLGVEMIVDRVRESGLRVDPRAADIAVALMSAGVHDSLVTEAGWSYDDYESWLRNTLLAALLGRD